MTIEKTCPKCPGSPPMRESAAESVLLATLNPDYNQTDSTVSKRAGVPVRIFICLSCNLVELYYNPQ